MSDHECFTKFEKVCCDSCSQESVCAVYYQYGTPVLATCKGCDLSGYERQASFQVNQWLTGK